jgi:type I restriction enzyme, R subunit
MEAAGYKEVEVLDIKKKLNFYLNLREEIKRASGETLDLKTYEADMRHLIDNYIQAVEPKKISPLMNCR